MRDVVIRPISERIFKDVFEVSLVTLIVEATLMD